MADPIVAVVEAAYAGEVSTAAWLDGIVKATATALGRGVVGNLVLRANDGMLSSAHVALHGVEVEWRETLHRTAMRMSSRELERRFTTAVSADRGVLAISASDDARSALLLDVPLDDGASARDLVATWSHVASHLAAGLRMRTLGGGSTSGCDETSGDAEAAWDALLEGRLALVDRFDRDGRRFVVARATSAEDDGALTLRERQVLASIARGHANKRIALELGVAESTVSTAIREAARKLGVRSRIELVRIFANR